MLTFAPPFASNIQHCVYGDVDIDTEIGYRTHSLSLRFVTILLLFSKM